MATIYDEVYRRAHDDPEGFWGARGRGHPLGPALGPGARRLAPAVLPLVHRRRAQHLLQRPRPPRRPRPRQAARADLRQPGHRHGPRLHLLRAARRGRAVRRARCAGRAWSKGDRVIIYMPMVPEAVIAMLACARIGADPLGGLRRLRRQASWPPASTTPGPRLILSASCGIEVQPGHPLQAAARPAPSRWPRTSRERCVILQRPQETAALVPGRDLDWDEAVGGGRAGRVRAGGGHRSALHPLHLGHHRHSQGRRARQRRPRGRAQVEHGERLRHGRRRDLLGGLRHRLGGRPLLHRLRAAAQGLHHDPLRGQAGRHARSRAPSGASSPSTE